MPPHLLNQKIKSETVKKPCRDFDDYVVQNQSSESLIVLNLEEQQVQ